VRRITLVLLPALVAAIVSIAAAAPAQPEARATALVARIAQPGLPDQAATVLAAPPNASEDLTGWSYPDDGSVVKIGSGSASVAAQAGLSSSAQGVAAVLAVSLFGGEIVVDSLDARATAAAGPANASADVANSAVTGLTVLGQAVTPAVGVQVPLADWGTLDVLVTSQESTQDAPRSASMGSTRRALSLLAALSLAVGVVVIMAAPELLAAPNALAAPSALVVAIGCGGAAFGGTTGRRIGLAVSVAGLVLSGLWLWMATDGFGLGSAWIDDMVEAAILVVTFVVAISFLVLSEGPISRSRVAV